MKMFGKPVADRILEQVAQEIEAEQLNPQLAIVITKDDPASLIYVRNKQRMCNATGITATVFNFMMQSEQYLHEFVTGLDHFDGLLVQLPLQDGFDKYALFDLIDPAKDVDCFSPTNVGLVNQNRATLYPCTPSAVIEMAKFYDVALDGKKVAVINRSDVIGKSLTMMLTHQDATVTLCHDHTPKEALKDICLDSDIIVVAVGIPNFITPDMVRANTVIFDVGINRRLDVETNKTRICGDVAPATLDIVGSYSPVPGGVGLVTMACLARNVLVASRSRS